MPKNSDVKEMADRSGELYMEQGDIGYAGAKIAVKRCFVLSEKIKLFLWLPGTCITNYFCIFDFFLQVHAFVSLKLYLSFEKSMTWIYTIFFIRYYDCLWLSSFVATMEKKPTLLRHWGMQDLWEA